MKAIITVCLILPASLAAETRAAAGSQGVAKFGKPQNSTSNPAAPAAVTGSTAQPQVESTAVPPDSTEALRLTVDLTDGSRLLGSPVQESFPWKTGFGPLTLKWDRLQSVEKTGEASRFSVVLRNGDRAGATPETDTFTLRTLLGDLPVPLALTRRIGVDLLASGSGPAAYWSFNDPANLGADDSGHGHPLSVMGAQATEGRIGKAAATRENRENQGIAEYLMAESHPDLQFSGDFTLAVWAWRSAPLYDGDQLIAKEGEFSLRRYQIPTERYDLELFGKQGLSLAKVSETKSCLPLESWTLIVVSRKDDRLTIRVNDLPPVEANVAPGEVGGDKPLIIGSSATGYPWHGKIDEIRKWNRALSEEEQCELFRSVAKSPISSGPVR